MAGKIKTKSSVAKRFKITGTGKLKHSKTCRNHLLVNKWRSTKKDKFGRLVDVVETKNMKLLMPYGKR